MEGRTQIELFVREIWDFCLPHRPSRATALLGGRGWKATDSERGCHVPDAAEAVTPKDSQLSRDT